MHDLGDFGSRLRRLRQKRRVSQQRLGDALGITHTAISRWESGIAKPTYENLEGIQRFLDASIDTLMFGHVQLQNDAVTEPDGVRYLSSGLQPGEWDVLSDLRQLTPETYDQIRSIIGKLAVRRAAG